MTQTKPFMIYPTETELDSIRETAKIKNRSINNFILTEIKEICERELEENKNDTP